MRVFVAAVGMSVLPMTVIAATCARAVGVHAGGVQTGLGGVFVGVTAIVSVILPTFMAVGTSLGV